ncbi:glycosyltransferase family 2 protein [Flavihumibacter petaseus]|uniref:Putative glycosyltransferase n=1 Tax=Flavihumibacter petaseus NBRC 106054 TaxID=1220578 RepID=A0A0E9MV04_9BACT|nr:glycosyltransferase family 2 protein [Flavihumibacter petaseus]GAO41333.1 putative glycosyltransferase [Flavihumibacter petaseus NBRC 106054]
MGSYVVYWLCFLVVLYTYLGYAMIITLIRLVRRRGISVSESLGKPVSVTVIIPAFNEAAVLGTKIRNTLEQSWSGGQLQIWVLTDGSDDGSEQIVAAFPQVHGFHDPVRRGKAAALNRAMEMVSSDWVVITDANTHLVAGSLERLATHFDDRRNGAVSGEKAVLEEGEGLYWRYESYLKRQDAEVLTLVGAAGELLAFRKDLYIPLEPDTVLDDFVLSLRICLQGYRVGYEPGAKAVEAGSASIREEEKRKIRIAAGGVQAMIRLRELLKFWKHPLLSFMYVSHRVLRWTLAPVCLVLFFFLNASLVISGAGEPYRFIYLLQLVFYGLALIGWIGVRTNTKWPFVYIPYYFSFMNLSVIRGWLYYAMGKSDSRWVKSDRLTMPVK